MGPIKKTIDYKKDVPSTTWKEWKKDKSVRKKKREEKLLASLDEAHQAEALVTADDAEQEEHIGRTWTVSMALPGNILDNAQTAELKTLLAGQIARAAAIFNVDEIVVFNEDGSLKQQSSEDEELTGADMPRSCLQLARILQLLECPQYLRKYFFPTHPDLRCAGLLNPLDSPHHYRKDDKAQFREGCVLEKTKNKKLSMVDVGLQRPIPVDTLLTPGLRVTVEVFDPPDGNLKQRRGKVVSPTTPQLQTGTYWGYSVRLASSLGAVFTQCPYPEGYDVLVGTSERGGKVPKKFSKFQHLLIAFGGLRGLELGLESDDSLSVDEPSLLFDHYLNTCPNQGSRTIRTEEALLVTLTTLAPVIKRSQQQ
ncbi:hypothetical protein B566_EDAN005569 [Ephemera danica]|nr:hypothetical protein B566_EDAN005569 [Ephemera danica]